MGFKLDMWGNIIETEDIDTDMDPELKDFLKRMMTDDCCGICSICPNANSCIYCDLDHDPLEALL